MRVFFFLAHCSNLILFTDTHFDSAMAYILAVNPRILADSGGPCVPDAPEEGGIFGAKYEECLEELTRQYVTATAIGSTFACLLMGFLGNLPVALAPGSESRSLS